METTASIRGARLSAQKGRLVADLVRGKPIDKALDMLAAAERPLIMAGGGVINADAADLLVELAELTGTPVVPPDSWNTATSSGSIPRWISVTVLRATAGSIPAPSDSIATPAASGSPRTGPS